MTMKTIVITLSSHPVFKNLFFFPGSFWEKLCETLAEDREKQLRAVVVMPARYKEKYGMRFKEALRRFPEQVFIEYVAIPLPSGIAARLFRFFYSYLIYTSTTRLLATMGTRPDEMPAGSRRLAFVKAAIASTFGKSSFIKQKAVTAFFDYLFPVHPLAELLGKYSPNCVFLPNLYGWFDTVVARDAKACGIKTVGMTANWDHVDKYFMPMRTDMFLAQNNQIQDAAVRLQGYTADRISVIGYPHFDFINRREYLASRSVFLSSVGFSEGAQYLLYISGSVYCPDEPEVIEQILRWIDEGRFAPHDVRLVIRPYLGGRLRDHDFDVKKFEGFKTHPRVIFYQRESWQDLPGTVELLNFMAHADAVLSAFSTAALEVALFDRPLIAIGFDGHHTRPFHRSVQRFEGFTHFQDVYATGGIRVTRNFDELRAAIKMYLDNPSLDGDGRALMRCTMCPFLDSDTSKRILDTLLKSCQV